MVDEEVPFLRELERRASGQCLEGLECGQRVRGQRVRAVRRDAPGHVLHVTQPVVQAVQHQGVIC